MAIINERPNRDAPASMETPYRMAAGERFRGELTDRADADWVRIEFEAGQTYTLTLHGIGPGPVTDTVLAVYDAGGDRVAWNDDVEGGRGQRQSRLEFTPESSGPYYLEAAAYTGNAEQDHSGRYELRVYDEDGAAPRTRTGTAGDDAFLAGGPGDDALDGGLGDDVLIGGPGADTLHGGPGQDTAWYGYSGSGVRVDLARGTARGGDAAGDSFGVQRVTQADGRGAVREVSLPDIECLVGSAHNDALAGNILPNTLDGGHGDDALDGRGGNDWLIGGAGADSITGGAGFDAVSYAGSPGGVVVDLAAGTARGGDAEGDTFPGRKSLTAAGAGGHPGDVADIEYLDGSEHDDTLAGDRGPDRLEGRGGDDTLNGRAGDDWLEGEAGADTLIGGPGGDTASYRYSDAGVTVRLHSGTAQGGHAAGDSFGGMDTFTVTENGESRTIEAPDIEHLLGSAYDDTLAGDGRNNHLDGGAGDDRLYGGPDGGDDVLVGGDGHDKLYGGKGDDTLDGGAGNDVLKGGPGNDTLTGGAGVDTFALAPGGGDDTALDFETGTDTLDLSAFADIDSVEDLDLRQQEGGLVLDLSAHGGGSLTLQGVDAADLTDAHFVFLA